MKKLYLLLIPILVSCGQQVAAESNATRTQVSTYYKPHLTYQASNVIGYCLYSAGNRDTYRYVYTVEQSFGFCIESYIEVKYNNIKHPYHEFIPLADDLHQLATSLLIIKDDPFLYKFNRSKINEYISLISAAWNKLSINKNIPIPNRE